VAALINPSILSADFANLERDIRAVADADWVHVDVMDNHFVPNLTIGLPVVERIREVSPLPLDVHLMIEDADRWAPQFAETGAQSVTFHVEAASHPEKLAKEIRRLGARVGMAVKPGTPLEEVEHLLPGIDMLLVMTVEPGFGGQSFMDDQLAKISAARALISASDLDVWIQVDGGISRETIARAAEAGANVFVAGSAIYGAEDIPLEIETLRRLAEV
jgi:ribulose-phosphate 3-epimerase